MRRQPWTDHRPRVGKRGSRRQRQPELPPHKTRGTPCRPPRACRPRGQSGRGGPGRDKVPRGCPAPPGHRWDPRRTVGGGGGGPYLGGGTGNARRSSPARSCGRWRRISRRHCRQETGFVSPWPPRWPWGCHCCTQRLREVLCVLLPPGRPSASPFAADLGDAHPLPGPRTHGTGRKGPVFTTTLYKASFYKKRRP